jgi:hypothetical protein
MLSAKLPEMLLKNRHTLRSFTLNKSLGSRERPERSRFAERADALKHLHSHLDFIDEISLILPKTPRSKKYPLDGSSSKPIAMLSQVNVSPSLDIVSLSQVNECPSRVVERMSQLNLRVPRSVERRSRFNERPSRSDE